MAFRSCIGCKTVCEKKDLLRLVLSGPKVAIDRQAILPGRGAYVHARFACVRKSKDLKYLAYRFRSKGVSIDCAAIDDLLAELAQDKG